MSDKYRDEAGYRRPVRPARRHPAEVTSDRLADHLDKWFDTTDGSLRDAISRVRSWLEDRAAEGDPA